MPKKSQTINAGSNPIDKTIALSYGAFEKLGWIVKYVGDSGIVGYTKISYGRPHETITILIVEGSIEVTSELPESASMDLFKKNQKNLDKFSSAYEEIKASAHDEDIVKWSNVVENLKQSTGVELEEQKKNAEEVEKVMNLSAGGRQITYGIMVLNVLVFVAMAISGVNVFEPTNLDIVNWGANFKPFTVDHGEWWRLFTCTFLHIGIVHLLFNMYALYMVGLYLEPMLGKRRYIAAYLSAGIISSIASLIWHGSEVISAGASGAIFGLFGVFLALLSTNLIPKAARQSLLQSIGIFVVFNLAYGMKAGIDNAAHVGGLLSGLVIGYIYFPTLRESSPKKATTGAVIVLALTILVLGVIMFQN